MEKMMTCLKGLTLALFAFILLISIFSLADEVEPATVAVKDKDDEPVGEGETIISTNAEQTEQQGDVKPANPDLDSIAASDDAKPVEVVIQEEESVDPSAAVEATVVPVEARKPAIVELETPDQLKRILLEKQDNAGASTSAQPQPNTVAAPSGSPGQAVPQSNSSSNLEKLPNVTVSGFNYAAMDAGAIIMAHNPESQGSSNLLVNDPDKYSLSPCSATQWFVIGLSEEILVTTVEVANYERYSSSVKTFQLYGAHKFPADEWTLLGEFERPSHRGTESFTLAQPKWARYVRFVVQSNHGNEVYCTLSKIRVYGQTTLETLREDLALSQQQIEAVRTTISDRQMQALAAGTSAANNNSTTTTAISSNSESIPADAVPVVDQNSAENNQGNFSSNSSTLTPSSADGNAKLQNATILESSFSGNASDSTQQSSPQQNAKEEASINSTASTTTSNNPPTTTTTTAGGGTAAATVDTYALSIVNGKPASMDNIFKTLMDKVKGVEIDVSVLKACLESNNDKVKVALQFLDSNIKELKEDFAAFASKQRSKMKDSDRMYVLEKELESLSKRQTTLETINFATMFMVMWLWYRG